MTNVTYNFKITIFGKFFIISKYFLKLLTAHFALDHYNQEKKSESKSQNDLPNRHDSSNDKGGNKEVSS